VTWAKRYALCHNKRRPLETGEKEIGENLTYLAVEDFDPPAPLAQVTLRNAE
jgi:hypothetical protein